MVFWAAAAVKGQNGLYGFSPETKASCRCCRPRTSKTIIGADGTAKQAAGLAGLAPPTGRVACLGCIRWPWNVAVSSITAGSAGQRAGLHLTPMGKLLRQMSWQGTFTFSNADWAARKRYVTSFGKRTIDTGSTVGVRLPRW